MAFNPSSPATKREDLLKWLQDNQPAEYATVQSKEALPYKQVKYSKQMLVSLVNKHLSATITAPLSADMSISSTTKTAGRRKGTTAKKDHQPTQKRRKTKETANAETVDSNSPSVAITSTPVAVETKVHQSTDSDGWKWNGTLMYYSSSDIKASAKLACFDFDLTLAKTSLFKKGPDAWSLLYPNIPQKLKKLHDDGFKLVIFTNQSDIGRSVKPESRAKAIAEKKGRLSGFIKTVNLPFQVFVATVKAEPKHAGKGFNHEGYDSYRKPAAGMWQFLIDHCNEGVKPDMKSSFFVGDAAGRPKDHSDADKKFAQKIPITFFTQDQYFQSS